MESAVALLREPFYGWDLAAPVNSKLFRSCNGSAAAFC